MYPFSLLAISLCRYQPLPNMPPMLNSLSAIWALSRIPVSRQISKCLSLPIPSQQALLFPILPRFQPHAVTFSTIRLSSTTTHALPKSPHKPKVTRSPQPEYEMTFTCKPCLKRSTHRVSKQGYHFGSVLITCPECRNRHIISDHLNVCVYSPL